MKMASKLVNFFRALSVLSLLGVAFSDPEFPKIDDIEVEFYTTEVQVTDMIQEMTAYATEYYSNLEDQGRVSFLVEGERLSVYYDNSTFEILEVNATTCVTWDADDSIFSFSPAFYGWLTKEPLVIGPSAPLWYAQTRRKDIVYEGIETARNIPCEKFSLKFVGPRDNVTYFYYFAPKDWTTPYKYENLRVPVRIHVIGESSKDTEKAEDRVPIDLINDFSYFKTVIDDFTDLQPPVGIGCPLRKGSDIVPEIPKVFQYAAEVVNITSAEEHEELDVNFERIWYDSEKKIARQDYYTRQKSTSQLFDFNSGVMYNMLNDRKCEIKPLRNSDFEIYDLGIVGRMKTPAEYFFMDGTFYDMGKREIRGIKCETYESVIKDIFFMGKQLHKLVITAYFTESTTTVGVNGEEESRIPVYFLFTGWSTYKDIAVKMQYNIFAFNDEIWPEMYSDFQLERCYTKEESKAYFLLILQVRPEDAAKMEDQNDLVIAELRDRISKYAEVPDMRIPFIKVDYKPSGVFATGLMLERPPSLLQFYAVDSGPTIAIYSALKPSIDAATIADCATACVDETDFTCKGFYFCGRGCFLKSNDPFEIDDTAETTDLGECDEYLRAERESSNYKNLYLKDALEKLESAVLNRSVSVVFEIPGGTEVVTVQDIIVGEGPHIGVDAGDKPYKLNIEFRKLDIDAEATKEIKGVDMLNDCYKKCALAETGCSSFSYCARSKTEQKQCLISSELVVKGITNDKDLIPSMECDIYDLKYLEYFIAYPEQVSYISGYKVIRSVDSLEKCAQECRLDKTETCRGFEYCRPQKTCSLHSKHILDLKPGEKGSVSGNNPCVHYAARYIADYSEMGRVLISDESNMRYSSSVEECAKICSEELGETCKSFNYCPQTEDTDTSCAFSSKLLRDDGVTTTEKDDCIHYEKRDSVHDWGITNEKSLSARGYSKKGFTGLVVGMLALGLIIGALGFIFYSYMRSRQYGEGMTVRFMKQDT